MPISTSISPGMTFVRHAAAAARAVALAGLALLLAGCEQGGPSPAGPQYTTKPPAAANSNHFHLAVHPLHNPKKLGQAYQPLIDHLNSNVAGASFELEASRDYAAYEAKFRARAPELLLPNPWQSLQAMKVGYRVIAMSGDAADFKGIFVVRRDSPLGTPADLKGKVIAYPAPTALAACIMPQWFLHRHGIDVNRDLDNRYVGSQESAILAAWAGDAAVGVTWPPPWREFQKDHPREAADLKVLWETPPLLNNSFMVRNDVPAAVAERMRELLLALGETPEGRAVLAAMETSRFHTADDASYEPIRDFVARFEKDVRPVEAK